MTIIVLKIVPLIFEGIEGFMVSRPAELPREPLVKRCVSLSTHTASIRRTLLAFLHASAQTNSAVFLIFLQEK